MNCMKFHIASHLRRLTLATALLLGATAAPSSEATSTVARGVAISFGANGAFAAIADTTSEVAIVSTREGQVVRRIVGLPGRIVALAPCPSGSRFIAISEGGLTAISADLSVAAKQLMSLAPDETAAVDRSCEHVAVFGRHRRTVDIGTIGAKSAISVPTPFGVSHACFESIGQTLLYLSTTGVIAEVKLDTGKATRLPNDPSIEPLGIGCPEGGGIVATGNPSAFWSGVSRKRATLDGIVCDIGGHTCSATPSLVATVRETGGSIENMLHIYSATTLRRLGSYKLPFRPMGLALNSVGTHALVSFGRDKAMLLNLESGRVLSSKEIGGR